jgi:protein TonB
MPSTAKDSFLESTLATDASGTDASNSQPSGPLGAEIPVTVHASRYSAAAKGGSKLPPVHEETRTVIIFPQGAVVRLSATVSVGELVVLTNNHTGADVICRVTSVKTQPGIQNYVNLEFTQRAVEFWQAGGQSQRAAGAPSSATSPAIPPPPIAMPAKPVAPPSQLQPPQLQNVPAKRSTAGADVTPISAKVEPLASLPDPSAANPHNTADETLTSMPHVSANPSVAVASEPRKQPQFIPSRVPLIDSLDSPALRRNNSSKKIAVIVAAAVALVSIGAIGGVEYLNWNRNTLQASGAHSAEPASPISATTSEIPASDIATPAASAPVNRSVQAPVSVPMTSRTGEPQLSTSTTPVAAHVPAETSKPELASDAPPAPRQTIRLGRIATPTVKPVVKLNSMEPPPVLPSTNTLSNTLSDSVVNTAARDNPVAPAAPAPASPKGGQLQQPKLISSVAAMYPAVAKSDQVQGDVAVDVLVDETGKVSETKVISGPPVLQHAAMDSVRHWKYEPARLNGQPIAVHIKVTVAFRLR